MMRVNDNGVYRDATPAEIAEMERVAAEILPPEPTEQDRLRADVDYLLMIMEG